MDPFPPGDQLFPTNGNGQSNNGLTQANGARNGLSKTSPSYGTSSSDGVSSAGPDSVGSDNDAPELVPVFEDQGERFDKARNSAMKVYVVLILAGVIIGAISLFGIVMVMQHFGLTDVPVPVEQR